MNLNNSFLNNSFSHIYVEQEAYAYSRTKKILQLFPNAEIIEINRASDIFNRKKQSIPLQHQSMSMILAKQSRPEIYHGSPVCQSFDSRYFYYTSTVKNCIYDCEYCWLKGIYSSGNLLIDVNIEDYFLELENLLKQHPVYLCVSYDTDLIPLEHMLGYAKAWADFTETHDHLTIEIRTKSDLDLSLLQILINPRVIIAYTLSPEYVSSHYEVGTPTTKRRIEAIQKSVEAGYPVRLCFDPMIPFPNWKKGYEELLQSTFQKVLPEKIRDISIGTFRLSENYLKKMRRQYPDSAVLQYPYVNENGYYCLPKKKRDTMEETLITMLEKFIEKEKIYRWEDHNA